MRDIVINTSKAGLAPGYAIVNLIKNCLSDQTSSRRLVWTRSLVSTSTTRR